MRGDIRQKGLALFIGVLAFGLTWGGLSLRPTPTAAPGPVTETPQPEGWRGEGRLSLTIRGPDDAPPDCAATLYQVLDAERVAMGPSSSQVCDAEGRLAWGGLEAGAWKVQVAGPSIEWFEHEIELGEGQQVDLGIQALRAGGRVHGVVREEGQPVDGVEVRATGGRMVVTKGGGHYRLDGLPEGSVEVRSGKGQSGGGGTIEVVAGETTEFDISLEPLPPRGVLGLRYSIDDEGVMIVEFVHPTGAAAALLRPGDAILRVDGEDIRSDEALARRLLSGDPGEPVRLDVLRDGVTSEIGLVRGSSDAL